MNPTEARERLCRGIYKTVEPANPLGLLQEALTLSITAEPIEKRIRVEGQKTGKVTALDLPGQITRVARRGIITETEAALLRDYDRKVMDLINVDDFAPHELGVAAQPKPATIGSAQRRVSETDKAPATPPAARRSPQLHRQRNRSGRTRTPPVRLPRRAATTQPSPCRASA